MEVKYSSPGMHRPAVGLLGLPLGEESDPVCRISVDAGKEIRQAIYDLLLHHDSITALENFNQSLQK